MSQINKIGGVNF